MRVSEQAAAARAVSYQMPTVGTATRNNALCAMADALIAASSDILAVNAEDVAAAAASGRAEAYLDRLRLTKERIAGMAGGLRQLAALPDPIGNADLVTRRPNGLMIEKRRVPLGVVGIIYEARPNVTSDAIGICVKTANCCVVRGGSDALRSNGAIAACLVRAASRAGYPADAIQFISDASRESAAELMRQNGRIDALIPRGGAGLIRSVVETASVPVIETGAGVCHTYVDASADTSMAANIVFNAKCSRPSVCNALETLLMHAAAAARTLPVIAARLAEKNVELRCCPRAMPLMPGALEASEADWATEYDDYILSVKVVDSLEDAIAHINRYGTHHSETIVTSDYANSERFLSEVDSAAVYVNASTRFTDGEEFGFGAEIGISTQKLHARGPMGLDALTSYKYVIRGSGQIR